MRRLAAAIVLALCAAPAPAAARERAVRRFDSISHGIEWGVLAEDAGHALWAGDGLGLLRFDGARFERVFADVVARQVYALVAIDDGVVALDRLGGLYTATIAGAAPLPGPLPDPASWIGLDRARRLAVIAGGRLWRREAGAWVEVPLAGAPAPSNAAFAVDGAIWLGVRDQAWRVDGRGAQRIWSSADGAPVIQLLARASGEVWICDFQATHVWRGGAVTTVLPADGRGRKGMLERGRSVWVATGPGLIVIPDGGAPEVVGKSEQLDGSWGSMIVDHEGSLWSSGFRAVYQFPEPDTAAWSLDEGLPSPHARRVTRGDDAIWFATWAGGGRLPRGRAAVPAEGVKTWDRICLDGAGRAWATSDRGVARFEDGRWVAHGPPASGSGDCSTGAGGRVWLTDDVGLHTVEAGGLARPVPGPPPAPEGSIFHGVVEDAAGWLWLKSDRTVCHARAADLVSGAAAWTCVAAPVLLGNSTMADADGELWIPSPGNGVYRLGLDGSWTLIDGSAAGRALLALRRSPRGGVWRAGAGVLERVARVDGAWRVVESPSVWQGLTAPSGSDVAEDPDGTLWIASSTGVVQVPPSARDAPMPPPEVRIATVEVDGAARAAAPMSLAPGTERIEVRFTAASRRDPSRLRYRYRLRAGAPWSAPTTNPVVTLVAPRPGRYAIEVAASLDGVRWSVEPARLAIAIRAPWFQRWYAWALVAALGAAVSAIAFAIRAALVRAAQRQRLRIARDLHDEIGSGLGSIGLLAGILREPEVAAGERGELAGRIADTATDLSGSLGDLVWSLKDGDPSVGGVAQRLVARAHDLFADGAVTVRAELPEPLPADTLALADRRHLLLLGLEALHNAARHAGARTVTIGLRRLRRGRHELWIADDGRGLDAPSSTGGSGLGLASMQARARALGSRLDVSSSAQGTRVAVSVRARGRATSRLGRWSAR